MTSWTLLSHDLVDGVSQDLVDGSTVWVGGMTAAVPPNVRLLIARWPDDAPRGAVLEFCRLHKISRSVFYKLRSAAADQGTWNVLEPRPSTPRRSPRRTDPELVQIALELRATLRDQGWDHGPLSVRAKLLAMGLAAPSRVTLARIFTRAGVVRPEPRKKPRSAYRRFVYPAPNCCWQIDATEWTLSNGRICVIFQLIDDHSRYALASLVAADETSEAALQVVKLAISRHGIPQKFLSDNGSALNPSRRGREGQLVRYPRSLGIRPITGKPGKPTTQGKNERFHQTLFKYLNRQPAATTFEDLQAQVDAFDHVYNTEREHQALPPGMTPRAAWDATPKAPEPHPPAADADLLVRDPAQTHRTVTKLGTISLHCARINVGPQYAGAKLTILYDANTVELYDPAGTEIATIERPKPGGYTNANPDRQNQPSTTS
jgi:putative transposase